MDLLNVLIDSTHSVGGKLLAVAGLLAAIGTLAMTAVETASNLWRGRMRMHRRLFQAWVRADLTACFSRMHAWAGEGDADTPSPSSLQRNEATEAERQFLQLACGDLRHAQILFDQPTDRFAAQLQAAANVALEHPAQYRALYLFLTQPVAPAPTPDTNASQADHALWLAFTQGDMPASAGDPMADAMRARARLGNLVSRRLDVFQNAARYRWDRLRQWAGSVLAGVLAAVVALQADWSGHGLLAVPFVLIAGALAPFANDVVNSLSRFGGKA
jgi:hypothetical protein